MRKLIMVIFVWFLLTGICVAQSMEFTLDAGSNSIYAGGSYKKEVRNGYMKTGIAALFTDDNDTKYKWGVVKLVAGNDTMIQGLRCEIGLKGIFGDAETDKGSGDVGALAFTIHAGYRLSEKSMRIPLEFFTELNHAPETLSFSDSKNFTEVSLGVGVHIINNASLTLTYTRYNIDMENGPGDWTLDENAIRAGVAMRF